MTEKEKSLLELLKAIVLAGSIGTTADVAWLLWLIATRPGHVLLVGEGNMLILVQELALVLFALVGNSAMFVKYVVARLRSH